MAGWPQLNSPWALSHAAGDGRRAADHLLHWSTNQRCPDRAAFVADMEAMFGERCSIDSGGCDS